MNKYAELMREAATELLLLVPKSWHEGTQPYLLSDRLHEAAAELSHQHFWFLPTAVTSEMEQAAQDFWMKRRFSEFSGSRKNWAGLFQEMIAAAPQPAEQQPTPDVSELLTLLSEARSAVMTLQTERENGVQEGDAEFAEELRALNNRIRAALEAQS